MLRNTEDMVNINILTGIYSRKNASGTSLFTWNNILVFHSLFFGDKKIECGWKYFPIALSQQSKTAWLLMRVCLSYFLAFLKEVNESECSIWLVFPSSTARNPVCLCGKTGTFFLSCAGLHLLMVKWHVHLLQSPVTMKMYLFYSTSLLKVSSLISRIVGVAG